MFKTKDLKLHVGINLIIYATKEFLVKRNILQHKIQQLRKTLVNEKKWQKPKKYIGLFVKNELGQAMFFFPDKIAAVRVC